MKLLDHKQRNMTEPDFLKILVAAEMGPKGQNWTENRVFWKFLRNASLDFFNFLHDARH